MAMLKGKAVKLRLGFGLRWIVESLVDSAEQYKRGRLCKFEEAYVSLTALKAST